MANVVVLGTQWGDEGKGKIVDLYAGDADVIARFQGGDNAGHTLVVHGKKTVLHLIPSGILHEHKICVLGNGMVINPEVFFREIEELEKENLLPPTTSLHISLHAHLILPYHTRIDRAREARKGTAMLGTTGKGIGPAYEDKVARTGIRLCDLFDDGHFKALLERNVKEKNFLLTEYFGEEPVDGDEVLRQYRDYAPRLKQYAADTSLILNRAMAEGKHILFEGAQGSHLDVDHGTYPYVTSSSTVAGNACTGTGVGPMKISSVIGVCKAYTTRVGSGPFVTELFDETGERLQRVGGEFGATTGRKRRCGWLDIVLVRQAIRLSGITHLVLTKLDVLTGIDPLKIAVGYQCGGERFTEQVPADLSTLTHSEPVYEELPGWRETLHDARTMGDLPPEARRYVERIEALAGIRVILVSVGAGRDDSISIEKLL